MKSKFIILFVSLFWGPFNAYSATIKTTNSDYVAAFSEKDLDRAISYVSDGDKAAFNQIIESGRVFLLKAGMKVYVVDSTWTGKVKIRLQGKTIEIWTVKEALR